MTATAISSDGRKPTVTARAEQMPSACTVMGLRASNGSSKVLANRALHVA